MDIRIGIRQVQRELSLESDESSEAVLAAFREAIADNGVLSLVDQKGRTVAVPAANIGYLELDSEEARPVGFGSV